MKVWIISIQEYDAPSIHIYDNKEEAAKHFTWAKANYNTDYHIEFYEAQMNSKFNQEEYE